MRQAAHEVVEAVAGEVLQSRRYRWLAPDLVRRLAQRELTGARTREEAVKRTKRRLHQVCGAYVWELRPEAALASLQAARAQGDETAWRDACRAVLAGHASTRERLPVLDEFYQAIFRHTGRPRTLIDLACGLGPLAFPWMGLPQDTTYLAYDVDRRLVELVDGGLTLSGVPHVAELRDVVSRPPSATAEVAFLLKSLTTLEQQAPGSARRVIDALNVPSVVVSFPTRSLGGAGKGMVTHYRRHLSHLLAGSDWAVTELLFPPELVFILARPG
ncbi:MAG TPA: 16S rRNA methyltransferase [Chloroflexota bacterium]|nr:16S rRNA methyltransferase [Chloroflexota bacterium]